jgi:uncharacterized membrane protein
VCIVEHISGGKAGEGQANKQPFMCNLLNKEQNDKYNGKKSIFILHLLRKEEILLYILSSFILLLFCLALYLGFFFLFVFSLTSIYFFFIIIILSFLHLLTCIFQAEHVLLSCSPILLKKKYIKDNKKKQGVFASLR